MRAQKADPLRHCGWCAEALSRKRFTSGRLEDRNRFLKRMYCDSECQRQAQVKPDATHKQTMMSRARKHKKSQCRVCLATSRLHIHHLDHNVRNNELSNLMTLCVTCHNRHHSGLLELPPSETP